MRPHAMRYPFEPGSLTDAEGAPALFSRYPMYGQALEWLDRFVIQPHPDLGRPGAVCPRLAPALRRNLVRLVAIRTASVSVDEAVDKGSALAGLYEDLFTEPEAFRAGALLAFFPDVPPQAAPEFIDGGHSRLRMDFVARGLMIGEFHPLSTVTSVRNPEFAVMRCPVPMFAVRALTRHDLLFLDRPDSPAWERAQYLKHLLHHLGDQFSGADLDRIHAGIAASEGQK
ncbi:DUF6875 domain-containing protein [Streptomyces lydicus]|uniref:DUF6875 domain-containing protein n=1 Tax=Streptomyces lydicus TaxID=47763 RepID=UPI001010B9B0|nr:hypothetical protein [Streptomyces lydicus]MCZ1012219.1 hypothetical protein [Streptomyces lydicus]